MFRGMNRGTQHLLIPQYTVVQNFSWYLALLICDTKTHYSNKLYDIFNKLLKQFKISDFGPNLHKIA